MSKHKQWLFVAATKIFTNCDQQTILRDKKFKSINISLLYKQSNSVSMTRLKQQRPLHWTYVSWIFRGDANLARTKSNQQPCDTKSPADNPLMCMPCLHSLNSRNILLSIYPITDNGIVEPSYNARLRLSVSCTPYTNAKSHWGAISVLWHVSQTSWLISTQPGNVIERVSFQPLSTRPKTSTLNFLEGAYI